MSLKKQFLKSKPVCKVTFSLPKEAAATANEVVILGEFNNWDPSNGVPMKVSKKEYKAVLELESGRNYEFRYLIDQNTWENDWAADDYVPTPFGVDNSVVFVPAIEKALTTKSTAKKAPAKKAPAPKAAPKAKATKDDLKKIEGVGPKIASLLNAAGIVTFADLGKAKKTELKAILEAAGSRYKMHDPSTWAKQAKLAAKGDWDKLNQLQAELNGGRA